MPMPMRVLLASASALAYACVVDSDLSSNGSNIVGVDAACNHKDRLLWVYFGAMDEHTRDMEAAT